MSTASWSAFATSRPSASRAISSRCWRGSRPAGQPGEISYLRVERHLHAMLGAAEEAHFGALAETWRERVAISYRRRTQTPASRPATSRISARAVARPRSRHHARRRQRDAGRAMLRLVRVMQADPKLGIVQGLVVGLPSTSAFARIFQFGMRLGMRSYTIGSAWWQGDCGPYWGHNAVLRLRRLQHCKLPLLRGRAVGATVARSDRGGVDAPRRLRGARAAGGKPRAGRRTRRRSSNLSAATCAGAGQHAVLAVPRSCRD